VEFVVLSMVGVVVAPGAGWGVVLGGMHGGKADRSGLSAGYVCVDETKGWKGGV
jgi:hypothetical protein